MATKKHHEHEHKAVHHKNNHEHADLLLKPTKLRSKALLIVIALLVVTGVFLIYKSFAASDSLSLASSTTSPALGSSFTVTVHENSNTDAVNAVEADLTYNPAMLQYISTNYSTSAFEIQGSSTGGSGSVKIARATATNVTNDHIVAVVTFTAIGSGSTPIGFAPSSAIVRPSDNMNILATSTGSTYTIADTQAPTVPTGLTAGAKTDTHLALTWTASTDNVGVTGYNILRNGTKIGTSATTSFSDTGLAPSTSYSYAIQAYDAAGNPSLSSAPLAMSTLADTTPPSTPIGLTAGTKTVTSTSLSWTASTDDVSIKGYKVLRNGAVVNANVTTTNYTDSGLEPNTSYSYTVQAVDGSNNPSVSSAALAISTLPDTTPPSAPTGLISPSKTGTTISLSWNPATDDVGVTGYKVSRNGSQVGTPVGTSYTDTGLSPGVAYSYTVAATDAVGHTSAQSTASSFSTVVKIGDVNGDGSVGILDLSILAAHYNQNGTYIQGDLNNDGVVDIYDLSILAAHWGT